MKKKAILPILFMLMTSSIFSQNNVSDFTIVFGSCSKPTLPQPFWEDIISQKPNVFIWGGDNVYADSENMEKVANDYKAQNAIEGYKKLKINVPIMGTWDDHDYGQNDAGKEWIMKKESQQLFLDFMGVSKNDKRRNQEGVYTSQVFEIDKGSVKIIVLDTRYFRTALKRSTTEENRYEPYQSGEGTILGEKQWLWLEKELASNYSDFLVIVSSIQFLSAEHGFETWGNFPHEVKKLQDLLVKNAVRNAIIISGDRHISEFSSAKVKGLKYPLIDFTSSGLTHSYSKYTGESNRYRLGRVISVPSFGVIQFNFDSYKVTMKMIGESNTVLQDYKREYPKN
ncbi:alkaline phosphatase family protein [Aquimarina sp. D1M17]|uniref:alkaline phosphatase D family protein n=1 Tax=Aquimarina acroporae TaxID=2937283 RepID=UPI0020BDB886|nr:alkaline phosphatase D family protein [Aquimarina acroporae]MCK8522779.1 alkaline phosphatase family protein [Aquimarina acroporae]